MTLEAPSPIMAGSNPNSKQLVYIALSSSPSLSFSLSIVITKIPTLSLSLSVSLLCFSRFLILIICVIGMFLKCRSVTKFFQIVKMRRNLNKLGLFFKYENVSGLCFKLFIFFYWFLCRFVMPLMGPEGR